MSLLVALIIGAIAGCVGGFFLMRGNADYFLLNILAGVVGSILGLAFFFFTTGIEEADLTLFSWRGMVASAIGALVVVVVFDGIHRLMPKRAAHMELKGEPDEKIDED